MWKLMIKVFVLVIATNSIVARPQDEDPNVNSKFLFLLNHNISNDLWYISIGAKQEPEVLLSNNVTDYDIDYDQYRLIWIKNETLCTCMNNSNHSNFYSKLIGKWNSTDENFNWNTTCVNFTSRIAYDSVTDKFYTTTETSEKIRVLDWQEKNRIALLKLDSMDSSMESSENERKIEKILLDSLHGLMFFLADIGGVKNIYKSNMDGSSLELLVSNVEGNQFDIDRHSNRIFWINAEKKVIESADYKGENKIVAIKMENPVPFAVSNNELYWWTTKIDRTFQNAFDINPKSAINVCQLYNNACQENSISQIMLHSLEKIHSIKAYRKTPKSDDIVVNPCQVKNGGCQHMCLLTSSFPHNSCVCYEDWEEDTENDSKCQERRLLTRLGKRQITWDMYSQQPTLRPNPQMPQQPSHIPIYIFYPGK